jgi:outer membrane protein TolC
MTAILPPSLQRMMAGPIRPANVLAVSCSVMLSGCSTSTELAVAGDGLVQVPVAARPATGTLALRELIRRGIEYNPGIKSVALDAAIRSQGVRREMAAFEPAFRATAGNEAAKRPLNTRELLATGLPGQAGRNFNDQTASYSAGLVGKLQTGTEYDLSFKGNRFKNDLNSTSPSSLFYPEYDSFAGLTITQPLLRGGGREVNLAQVNMAKADERIAVLERTRKTEEIALEITLRYCDLVFACSEIGVRREGRRLADSLASDHAKRVEQGIGTNVEVLEAQSAAENRADEVEVAITRMIEVQSELRKLVGPGEGLGSAAPPPAAAGVLFGVPANRDSLIAFAIRNRLDYRQARIGLEKQDIEVRYAKNQKWPQLDLNASCGVLGLDGSTGRAVSRAASGDNPFWSVGVSLTIPLGGSEADSQLQAANLRKMQALLELQKIEQQIVIEIEGQLAVLEVHRNRVATARKTVEIAAKLLDAENQKLAGGTTTGFAVLEAQRNLIAASSQELSAVNDYNRSAAKLAYMKGSLLGDVGFEVVE